MVYQWFPGHMTKAIRMMQEDLKLIDLVMELVDARIPLASRNPDIDKMAANKSRIILLNKCDLATEKCNNEWINYFEKKNIVTVKLDSRSGHGIKQIQAAIELAMKEKIERDRKRGIKNRPVRAMVVGIPNVGKSTFINALAGKSCTKTGNKPGVTKGKQWIKLNKNVELLDTPGILWPKFEDQRTGMLLAFIGSINDDILVKSELAIDFIKYAKNNFEGTIAERYGIDEALMPHEILEAVAIKRGCLKKGGEADLDKAAHLMMDDFRMGRLGRITLEKVPD